MNKKIMFSLFVAEAAVCVFFNIFRFSAADVFTSIWTFPFEQIGLWLRALSLSGVSGNIMAIILYIVICIAPCIALLIIKRKRLLFFEDILLVVLSALLFAILYKMINPGLITPVLTGSSITITKAIMGGTAYSLICAYTILRILRLFISSETSRLQKYMVILLMLVNAIFIYIIFGSGVSDLINSFKTLKAGNTGNEHLLGISYVFLVIQYIVDNIPFALNILVVFTGVSLLHALASDQYSIETVALTEKLSKVCRFSLIITVLSNVLFNILQFLFIKNLNIINSIIQIPVFSIVFVLAVLILSRLAFVNKALKDENDSII